MAAISDRTLPKGSTILVTGAKGFLGSHIVDQFLRQGHKVRGTVRDPRKEHWLIDLFRGLYGKESFELVQVADMAQEGAFDQAMRGVDAVAHSASVMTFDHDPNKVIPITIAGALNALKAAYAESSVKRFVLTSSSSAALTAYHESAGITVTEETFNEEAVKLAWEDPPYEVSRGPLVYNASKTQAEQEVWRFHKENHATRPDLVVNAVLPNLVFGKSIDPVGQGYRNSASLIPALWNGQVLDFHHVIAPQYFVDVEDAAILHVAAALFPHVEDQRIFAFAETFNWDAVLDVLKENDPKRELPGKFASQVDRTVIEPRPKAEKLLQDMGRPGWTSLKDSVLMNIQGL